MVARHFAALTFFISFYAAAERYVVEDDSFGNASATKLSEVSSEEVEKIAIQQSEAQSELQSDPSKKSSPETVRNQSADTDLDAESSGDPVAVEGGIEEETDLPSKDSDVKENPFEAALREQQRNETDEVVLRLLEQGGDDFDATKVNPAEFVDSQDLLEGNVNSAGEQPFYVTYDSVGESNVIFYSPKVIQDEINRRQIEEQVSRSVIHRPPKTSDQVISLPAGADPKAASILLSGGKLSYFDRFISKCCVDLPNVGVINLRDDKPSEAVFKREDFSYRFVDGDSRYRLVLLPNKNKNYLLTIKTFVRSYKKKGIDNGAFIPQIVMLDRDKNVRRIISDVSAQFHAETWTTYGYLKSVIEVEQTDVDAERFLLLYTRANDLRTTTTIEDSSGSLEIRHMEVGSVEVTVVESSLW